MAAPTYATDLTTIVDFDGTPASPTVAEPGTTWTAGRTPVSDTDFPIQSTNHASLTMNTTGKAGILCTNGTTGTWVAGNYLFGWIIWLAPGAIAAEASGGLVMLTGSGISDFKVFYIGGNVSGKYPYGGWQNFAVDPTMTPDETIGTPTAYNIVGAGANVLTAVSKGNPLGFDVFRYGRGILRVGAGDGTTPATFAGMAAANDASSARWGLFEANPGVFKYKGVIELGTTACTFIDSNKSIVIDPSKYVAADFNKIEIKNASSSITWTNININSLATVSKGNLHMIDNATVVMTGCTFVDMNTFIFGNATLTDTVFRRCGLITAYLSGTRATFTRCTFDSMYTGTRQMDVANCNLITDSEFISPGGGHAIRIVTTGSHTLDGNTFTGYASSDGSTGNEAIYNDSGGAVTLYIANGAVPSIRNGTGASTTVVQSNNLTVTVDKDTTTEVRVYQKDTPSNLLGGIESIGATKSFTLAIDAATYPQVDVAILSLDYQNEYRNDFSMTGGDKQIDVQQRVDRQFDNP